MFGVLLLQSPGTLKEQGPDIPGDATEDDGYEDRAGDRLAGVLYEKTSGHRLRVDML